MPECPAFFYFDLGKVLLDFDRRRGYRRMAAVSGAAEEQIARFLEAEGRQRACETGLLSNDELFEQFCLATGTRPHRRRLLQAAGDIFSPRQDTIDLLQALHDAGCPLGLLSNTCPCHWQVCTDGRFPFLELFRERVLSFRHGAMKPDAALFEIAARQAGFSPPEIFFVDDLPENVAGARACGFDAVLFTGNDSLRDALRSRGVPF